MTMNTRDKELKVSIHGIEQTMLERFDTIEQKIIETNRAFGVSLENTSKVILHDLANIRGVVCDRLVVENRDLRSRVAILEQ